MRSVAANLVGDAMYKTEEALRQEIMLACRANGVPNLDAVWLSLVFCSHSELIKMCRELHIKVSSN